MISVESRTYIAFSLAADAILISVFIFLWFRQRREWHALLWALGQASLTASTAIWFLGSPHWPKHLVAAITLSGTVAGFWAGTEYFLGNLRRRHLQHVIIGFSLLAVSLYALWSIQTDWVESVTAVMVGSVILWTGFRLTTSRNRYRLLGMVMMARGVFNLVNSLGVLIESYEVWFVFSTIIKTVSLLCLIYAVQEKIRHRYTHTIDSLSSGFLIQDREGVIQVANERCARLFGYPPAQNLVGSHVADHMRACSRDMVRAYFRRFEAAEHDYPFVEIATIELHNGAKLPLEMIASPYMESGELYCMVQLLDITERNQKDALLHRAAYHDAITGFFNRHGLSRELGRILDKAHVTGSQCAVLFLDTDKFKRVNDSFGHTVGDQLLYQLALRLHGALREHDILSLFAGNEFVIILPCTTIESAHDLAGACAQRIMHALASHFIVQHHCVSISANIGIACLPADGADADTLIHHANIAMLDAKKAGEGQIRFFDTGMAARVRDILMIDAALRNAIAGEELRLVYQAIVHTSSRQVYKVEALLRWHSAQLGHVPPDRFIPIAEDSEMILALGNWVLHEACRQMARWDGALGESVVSINVSARQLAAPDFVAQVELALANHGLKPRQLELELTERVLIDDGMDVMSILAQLSALGISISLDDFGTGYSSLSYLTRFKLDTLKIDRSFVTDIEHCPRSKSLVATVIAMGHNLGMELVAEGVETAGQAAILEEMGCHYLQGYHIARPLAPDALFHTANNHAVIASTTQHTPPVKKIAQDQVLSH